MSEPSFDQMIDQYARNIRNGDTVTGTVIDVKPDQIVLNIGYKSDGIVTRQEYSNDSDLDLTTVVNVGDELEVRVMKVDDREGQVLLSRKTILNEKVSERLQKACDEEEVLTAVVDRALEGGLNVTVDDTRVFIPASLVSDTYVKDLKEYEGKEIEFVIIEYKPQKRRVIGDRRRLLTAQKEEKLKELLDKIQVGDVITGTVKNVTAFGAFVDIGGADGLLHISEMSWGRVDNPKKHFKSGDEVRVFIKDIKDDKIALSMKFEDENPWKDAETRFAVGNVVKGTVARMTEFGAFVSLAPGVDALLHVSQISREHIEQPKDVLSVGQEVEAKIVDFNEENHKISLSIKALLAPPKSEKKSKKSDAPAEDDDEDIADVDIAALGAQLAAEAEAAEAAAEEAEAEVAAAEDAEESAEEE